MGKELFINILVKPNAAKTAIMGFNNDLLSIRLHAQPIEGAANKELVNYLSKLLKVPKTSIEIVSGQTSKNKRLQFHVNETKAQEIITILLKATA